MGATCILRRSQAQLLPRRRARSLCSWAWFAHWRAHAHAPPSVQLERPLQATKPCTLLCRRARTTACRCHWHCRYQWQWCCADSWRAGGPACCRAHATAVSRRILRVSAAGCHNAEVCFGIQYLKQVCQSLQACMQSRLELVIVTSVKCALSASGLAFTCVMYSDSARLAAFVS